MLKDQAVDAAHHDDDVENDDERRHRSTETKSGVKNNERNREQRQPDVSAQPALDGADPPKDNFFPRAEQRGENEDRQCDRAEN